VAKPKKGGGEESKVSERSIPINDLCVDQLI